MQPFLNLVKTSAFVYSLLLSLVTSVLLINTVVDFSEKLIRNPQLILITITIFGVFLFVAYRWEVWKDES